MTSSAWALLHSHSGGSYAKCAVRCNRPKNASSASHSSLSGVMPGVMPLHAYASRKSLADRDTARSAVSTKIKARVGLPLPLSLHSAESGVTWQHGQAAAWRNLGLDLAVSSCKAFSCNCRFSGFFESYNHFFACRVVLQAVNFVLAVSGVFMLGYAAYMYVNYEHISISGDSDHDTHHSVVQWIVQAHRHASPW